MPAVGKGEPPDALDRVNAIANPGIAVIAMHRVGRAGGEQAGDRMLATQHHPRDRVIQLQQQVPLLLV